MRSRSVSDRQSDAESGDALIALERDAIERFYIALAHGRLLHFYRGACLLSTGDL